MIFILEANGRMTKGRADLKCQGVLNIRLNVAPDPATHFRCANIIWEGYNAGYIEGHNVDF